MDSRGAFANLIYDSLRFGPPVLHIIGTKRFQIAHDTIYEVLLFPTLANSGIAFVVQALNDSFELFHSKRSDASANPLRDS